MASLAEDIDRADEACGRSGRPTLLVGRALLYSGGEAITGARPCAGMLSGLCVIAAFCAGRRGRLWSGIFARAGTAIRLRAASGRSIRILMDRAKNQLT